MDNGRKYDLIELHSLRAKAKSGMERERIEKVADKIMRESGAVRSRREDLIKAVRGDDIRAIKRINHELTVIKMNENYGKH